MYMHNKEVEDYNCETSGTECKTRNELRVHMGSYTKKELYNFCNMKFMTRQLLKCHMMHVQIINIK